MAQFETKVCLLGDGGVGKTQIVNRLLTGRFEEKYEPTLGVEVHPIDFTPNNCDWTDDQKVRFNVWDLAGQEKFYGKKQSDYLSECFNFIVCYSSIDKDSKTNALGYWTDLILKEYKNPKIVYVMTKGDLTPNVSADKGHVEVCSKYITLDGNLQEIFKRLNLDD